MAGRPPFPRRDPACQSRGHSKTARRTTGCICPRREEDRADDRARSRAKKTGPIRGRLLRYDTDVDDVSLRLALAGDPPTVMTKPERRIVVAALTDLGESAVLIAAKLRCNSRTVVRYRSEERTRRLADTPVGPNPPPPPKPPASPRPIEAPRPQR